MQFESGGARPHLHVRTPEFPRNQHSNGHLYSPRLLLNDSQMVKDARLDGVFGAVGGHAQDGARGEIGVSRVVGPLSPPARRVSRKSSLSH
jgi:hypothetical protein